MTTPLSTSDWEKLSAYLDGQLSASEQTRLTQRLEARPELKRALEDLRQTRLILRSAPRRRAPRNFTLTPQMVPQRRTSWFNLVPSLGLTSAFSTLVLIISLLLPRLQAGAALTAAAPAAPTLAAAALLAPNPATKALDSQSQPTGNPIITWSFPNGSGGGSSGAAPEATGLGGGPPSAPQVEATPLPAESLGEPPTLAPQVVDTAPPLQGSGPILGIRPTEEQGRMSIVGNSIEELPGSTRDLYQATPDVPVENPQSGLPGLQILLGILALATGAAAILLSRKS